MAKRNLVTNEIKTSGGGFSGQGTIKKAPTSGNNTATKSRNTKTSGGMGYTATATNRKTGQKTTKSGTLTPVSESEFKSGGKGMAMKRELKRASPTANRKASGTGGLQSRTSKHTTRKIY